MLYVFGFGRTAVAVGDLYFVDPHPHKGQEGAERGVRVEVRLLDRGALRGSMYSATPIGIGRPVWRADLLESVEGKPGSFDRAHYHPALRDWEPGNRVFDRELSADPLAWLGERLSDLEGLLAAGGAGGDPADAADAAELRRRAPEIIEAVRRLLDQVRAGELAGAGGQAPSAARLGWL